MAGQTRIPATDTAEVVGPGVFMSDAQFLDMTAAIDSLDYFRTVAGLEEAQKIRWRDLYTRLDSMYTELRDVKEPDGFGLRDAGFWALMGGAAAIVVNEILQEDA